MTKTGIKGMRRILLFVIFILLLMAGCSKKVTKIRVNLSPSDYVLEEQEEGPEMLSPLTLSSYVGNIVTAGDGSFVIAENMNSLSVYDTQSWKMTQDVKPDIYIDGFALIDYHDFAINASSWALAAVYGIDDALYITVYERAWDGFFRPTFTEFLDYVDINKRAEVIGAGDNFCIKYYNSHDQGIMIPLVMEDGTWSMSGKQTHYADEGHTNLLYCSDDTGHVIYRRDEKIVSAIYKGTGAFGYPQWDKLVIGEVDGNIEAVRITADGNSLILLISEESGLIRLKTIDIETRRFVCEERLWIENRLTSASIAPDCMSFVISSFFSSDTYVNSVFRKTGTGWECTFVYPCDVDRHFFLGNDVYGVEASDHIVRLNEAAWQETDGGRNIFIIGEEDGASLQVAPDGSSVIFGKAFDDHSVAYTWDGKSWIRRVMGEDPVFLTAADECIFVRRNWSGESAVIHPDGNTVSLPFTPLAHTADLSHMITVSDDGFAIMQKNEEIWSEKCRIKIGKDYSGIYDCPGQNLFVTYDGKKVRVFDWDGNSIDEIACRADGKFDISMSEDGRLIALAEFNNEEFSIHILEKGEDGWSDTFIRHGTDSDDDDRRFSSSSAMVMVTTSGQVVVSDTKPLTLSKRGGEWKVTEIWDLAGSGLNTRQFAVSRDGDVFAGADGLSYELNIVIGRK